MALYELAPKAIFNRIDVAFDSANATYCDLKFGDYSAAVAELIRP